ncbi:Predicted exporter of the RND superfamily [hydrothermal vent metagenome]|uniref:Predicted exporter of the RND superfamily n=1 Tax=hydrothermal vent metagenome TaxID=652676 RepID=A0A3B1CJD4_9ZZZZ
MRRFEAGFGKWVVRRRWVIIVISILVMLAAASGMRFLTFNNDSRVFFSDENPQLKALDALENTYTKNNNILFVVAPKGGEVFTRKTLAMVEELTTASWKTPYSSRVDSITNFQHTYSRGDELVVEDLIEGATSLTDDDLSRAREIALGEPLLLNRLISSSAHVTGVNVMIIKPGLSDNEPAEVALFARDLVAQFKSRYPDIDIYLAGGVMMDNGFAEAVEDDMFTLIPAMYVALLLITGFALRSITGTFTTLLIILFSIVTGLGLAGWLGISITTGSVNAPVIIMTLAVADSIHLLVTMFQEMRAGKTKWDAISESIRINLQPVFITSLTTSIGFLSMNFSDAPPFHDLGNIVAMGVGAAFLYSVFFLPAAMAVLPVKVSRKDKPGKFAYSSILAEFVINRRKEIFWGMLAFIVLLTSQISRIELNDDFIKYFDTRYDFRRASDFAQENLTGFYNIEYSLESGSPGGINDPEFLNTVDKFVSWHHEQDKVVNVNSITETIKRLNKNMHGDDPAYYKIPESRELAAQYLLLYEMSVPFGLDLNDQINVDKSATRMIVTFANTTTRELRAADEKARYWLGANAPASMFTYGSGLSIIWAHISERNINSMLLASFGALALISGLLIFALRSVKIGLISLIPNLAPAFMAFGVWGLFVGQVGLALSVLLALTMGIIVDDTVHFLSKYLRARREKGMNPADAVRYSFDTVGSAIWVTSIALVAGFSILTFSGFSLNSEMGLMTAITITLALILDFLFLPTLLMKVEDNNNETSDRYTNGAGSSGFSGSIGEGGRDA